MWVDRIGGGASFVLHDDVTDTTLLLGCGERKMALDGEEDDEETSRQYAQDMMELVRRDAPSQMPITAVLVPDYRPESCFMLPYLTEKCFAKMNMVPNPQSQQLRQQPPIYLSHGTRAIGPHVLTEYWDVLYGSSKDSSPMYDSQDITTAFAKSTAISMKACMTVNENLKITAYHAGHVPGGCVYYIEIGASSVLFALDFNLVGGHVLLPASIPKLYPTALIVRSAFAVSVSETRLSMERDLTRVMQESLQAGGKVVIPVYRMGFFQELLTILLQYWQQMQLSYPIYITDEALEFPNRFTPLLQRTYSSQFKHLLAERAKNPSSIPDHKGFDWSKLQKQSPACVVFTSPANIAYGNSLKAIKACANDPKNLIVLSEHCKPGTTNYLLYADAQRREVSKRLGVHIACGVHYFPCGDEVDAKSVVEFTASSGARQVLLDAGTMSEDVQFIRAHVLMRLKDELTSNQVTIQELHATGPTKIKTSKDIPLRIHRSMLSDPAHVNGALVAESKRKLSLVTIGSAARRLKKKRHTLQFNYTWKKEAEPSIRHKKKASRGSSSALSFLLSANAESSASENEAEDLPKANVMDVLDALEKGLGKWLQHVQLERDGMWIKVRSVGLSVTPDWEVSLEWSFEDEELAGRVLGIAKQVVNTAYASQLEQ